MTIQELSGIIEFTLIPAVLLLIKLLSVVKSALDSLHDLKREMYKNNLLPDRGEKGERY
jgi:hypothetical protein